MAMFNVASLAVVKQLGEIRLILLQKKLDVLTINETRLDSTISGINGYNVLRADRNRNGGSVCIYVRCRVKYISGLVSTDLEAACVEIN